MRNCSSDHQKKYSNTTPLDTECIMRFNILSAGIHWTLNLPSIGQHGKLREEDEKSRMAEFLDKASGPSFISFHFIHMK